MLAATTTFIKENFNYQMDLVKHFGTPPEWEKDVDLKNWTIKADRTMLRKNLFAEAPVGSNIS